MKKTLILAIAVAAFAAPALAQQGPPRRSPEELAAAFDKADANKDGKLDKTEIKATLPEEFQAQVSEEQLALFFARRDADKDGFVTKAEFTAPPARPAQ